MLAAGHEDRAAGTVRGGVFGVGRAIGERRLALDTPATYLNWNFILISIPNLLMIAGMIVVFLVALVAPFPRHAEVVESEDGRDA
jgi:hypothetical protein